MEAKISQESWEDTLKDIAFTKKRVWELEIKVKTLEVILGMRFLVNCPESLPRLINLYTAKNYDELEEYLGCYSDSKE